MNKKKEHLLMQNNTVEDFFKNIIIDYLDSLNLKNQLDELNKEQVLTYTTKQLANALNLSNTAKIDTLRRCGAIEGIKKGNGYIFSRNEVEQFLESFKGLDISNEETIKTSVAMVKRAVKQK